MNENNAVKLCYYGGSGGFIVLHLLLLSGKFFCKFQENLELSQIIKDQWNIPDPSRWKSTEIWPDNNLTKQSSQTNLRKLYFFFKPNIEEVQQFEGRTVLLYVNASSQIELARYKQVLMFFNEPTSLYKNYVSYYRQKLQSWQKHYKNIKDSSWPRCTGPGGFKRLPKEIQDELLLNPFTLEYLNFNRFAWPDRSLIEKKVELKLSNLKKINGVDVFSEVAEFSNFCDLSINLIDILNDLNSLSIITGCLYNHEQQELKDKWISLHPPKMLESMGVNLRAN